MADEVDAFGFMPNSQDSTNSSSFSFDSDHGGLGVFDGSHSHDGLQLQLDTTGLNNQHTLGTYYPLVTNVSIVVMVHRVEHKYSPICMPLQMQGTQGTMFNSNMATAGQVRAFSFGHNNIMTMD